MVQLKTLLYKFSFFASPCKLQNLRTSTNSTQGSNGAKHALCYTPLWTSNSRKPRSHEKLSRPLLASGLSREQPVHSSPAQQMETSPGKHRNSGSFYPGPAGVRAVWETAYALCTCTADGNTSCYVLFKCIKFKADSWQPVALGFLGRVQVAVDYQAFSSKGMESKVTCPRCASGNQT